MLDVYPVKGERQYLQHEKQHRHECPCYERGK